MGEQNSLKCLYCDYRSSDTEERKKHLKERHYAKMLEIAKKSNQTIDWAAGYTAAYFTEDNAES
jgi:hypothetical protein